MDRMDDKTDAIGKSRHRRRWDDGNICCLQAETAIELRLKQSPKGFPIAHAILSHDEPRHIEDALLDEQVHLFLHGVDAIPKSLDHPSHLRLKDLSDSTSVRL